MDNLSIELNWMTRETFQLREPIPHDRAMKALKTLTSSGQSDGAHHKAFAIDAAVKALLGEDYAAFVAAYNSEDFTWETGIE